MIEKDTISALVFEVDVDFDFDYTAAETAREDYDTYELVEDTQIDIFGQTILSDFFCLLKPMH